MTSPHPAPEHTYTYIGQTGTPETGLQFHYLERFAFPPGQGPTDGLGLNIQHAPMRWAVDGWRATKKLLKTWP